MAYQPSDSQDFDFSIEPYLPDANFQFYPELTYIFYPPPKVVSFKRFLWQRGTGLQASTQSSFGETLPTQQNRSQSSQQATVKESLPVGLFWNQVITEKPEPEQPDIRESYLLMNTITTVTLPDRTPSICGT